MWFMAIDALDVAIHHDRALAGLVRLRRILHGVC